MDFSNQKLRRRIILVASVMLVFRAAAAPVPSPTIFEIVKKKLDSLANGVTQDSQLTREELLRLVNYYKRLPGKQKAVIENGQDQIMLHFVILPTIKFESILLSLKPESFDKLKSRIEDGYKSFKPAYAGKIINGGLVSIRHEKISRLYEKLCKRTEELKLEDFEEAREQATAWKNRLLEIVKSEDVFSEIIKKELSSILNLMNSVNFRPLFASVFPLVGSVKDPEVLKNMYFQRMWDEYRMKLVNGKWEIYKRRNQ
jgi:hypothetical protein